MTSFPHRRRRAPATPAARDEIRQVAILQRGDVAAVPLFVICIASFALALSEGLRPPARPAQAWADELVIIGSLVFGVVSAAAAVLQNTPPVARQRGRLWVYLGPIIVLMGSLTLTAALDSGLASVAYHPVVLVLTYVGLVMPKRPSRITLLAVLASMGVVHLITPEADFLEAASIVALCLAGWASGVIPRLAHSRASRQALLLSRTDVLTGALNRRGFFEGLDWALTQAREPEQPVALLVIDLNDFKSLNDLQGHAAGDELLAWVGRQLPEFLPPGGALGRLGGDEFAVVAPGLAADEALALGQRLHGALAERIGSSVGVAYGATGHTSADALMRDADLALYAAKADPACRVQLRETARDESATPRAHVGPPAVPYAWVRARMAKRTATAVDADPTFYGPAPVIAGFATVAAAGAVFVASTIVGGGDTVYQLLIIYLGIPWVLLNIAMAAYFAPRATGAAPGAAIQWSIALTLGVGIGTAALSTGDGATSPIVAGLYLAILFNASVFTHRQAQEMAAVLVACWALVLLLGPRASLWAAPYEAVLLGGAYFIGSIGRDALTEATSARMHLASTDPLTGLLNRRGFVSAATRSLTGDGAGRLAVITLDLDGFKLVNDTRGHAVGDLLLQAVASVLTDALEGAEAVGRLGGDEFVAAVRVADGRELDALVQGVDERLAVVTAGSVGAALQGPDGADLGELLRVADGRAYAVKGARAAERRRQLS